MRRWGAVSVLVAVAILRAIQAAPANDFRFAVVGDRTGTAIPGVYERIWREIGREKPDFAINVGDTIEGTRDAMAESEWRELRPIWSPNRFPFYLTPGNHDIWSPKSLEIYKQETGRPNYYSFNHQNAHFTVLDNSRTDDLSESQLLFLEEDLKANRDRNPKFVFFHKPYWIAFLMLGSGDFPLHQLARKHGVQYVISGHGHQFLRMTRDGITYLEVGSSGAKLKGEGFTKGWFYHYVSVEVSGLEARFTVKPLDGKPFRADEWPIH